MKKLFFAWICLSLVLSAGPLAGSGRAAETGSRAEYLAIITPDWYVDGDEAGGQFAYAAAPAGDVNRDGYADVIVGSPNHVSGEYSGGAAWLYLGGPQGLSPSPAWSYGLSEKGARFGAAAASAGDVNADGYDDVIIGAYRCNHGEPEEGCAYLFLGGPYGLETQPAWTFESNLAGAQFGYAVSRAGDVDGDGYGEVLVGARWYTSGEANEGAVYLFTGDDSGLDPNASWIFESDLTGATLGTAVAGPGDLNDDGYDDIAAGAPHYTLGQPDEGAVLVFYGGPGGPSAVPDWLVASGQSGSMFGGAVEPAGDINSDGIPDLMAGAPQYAPDWSGGIAMGAVFIYSGSPVGLSPAPDWCAFGTQGGAEFGISGGTAGDVNADGYPDFLVGAFRYDDDQPDEGGLFVYFGDLLGLSAAPSWAAYGDKAETWFGFDAHSAGDVNGDGYSDLIAGAPLYRHDTTNLGRAMVFHGKATPPLDLWQVFLPEVRQDP